MDIIIVNLFPIQILILKSKKRKLNFDDKIRIQKVLKILGNSLEKIYPTVYVIRKIL